MKCLKSLLMHLGNELVTRFKREPVTHAGVPRPEGVETMGAVVHLQECLNADPEAIQVLGELGVAWPVVDKATPIEGRQYAITGTSDEPSMMRGDSTEACLIPLDEAPSAGSFKHAEFDNPTDYEVEELIKRVDSLGEEVKKLRLENDGLRNVEEDLRSKAGKAIAAYHQIRDLTKISPKADTFVMKCIVGPTLHHPDGEYEVREYRSVHPAYTAEDQRGQLDAHTILNSLLSGEDFAFNYEVCHYGEGAK